MGVYFLPMKTEHNETPRHPIRVVSRRTGLTAAVLRAWEKRYGVVTPGRSEGGQRLYSDDDVARLALLNRVVAEGRSISHVAGLSTEELEGLAQEDEAGRRSLGGPGPLMEVTANRVLDKAEQAVARMDPEGLERILKRGAMALPVPTVMDEVVVPLLAAIGRSWEFGRLGPAHEHLATVVVRRFLEWMLQTVDVGSGGPVLVAGTMAGERHELGGILAAIAGATEGWKATYLGPDLPATEIVSAARRLNADVVALSCVDPRNSDRMILETKKVREGLPPEVRMLLGGPEAVGHSSSLVDEGVEVLGTFRALRERLSGVGV